MSKPLGQADPFFSQPVRQIVMMLMVTGLVVAGGYFAYARILPIFIANPWLNGLIIAVFVIGVLTCFWQVAQLVRSVSWIEGFAAHRPGHEITIAPRLLAPLAALLRSRGKHQRQISSSSARSILESVATRMEEARDITRYLTSLLIFLGLLGTFYGLAITVPAVVDTIRALAPAEGESGMQVFDKLMSGLEAQLGGMGTAFSSSLLGLAGSLVVGLLELFAGHGQNRFYRELEEWLTSFTRLGIAGGDGDGSLDQATVAGVLDQMAEQVETLRAVVDRTEEGRRAVNERLDTVAGALAALTHRLEADGGTAGPLAQIAAGQARLVALAEADRTAAPDREGDAESRMRLRSIDMQLVKLIEEVAAGRQESLADLRSDLSQLTRAVRTLGRAEPSRPEPSRPGAGRPGPGPDRGGKT